MTNLAVLTAGQVAATRDRLARTLRCGLLGTLALACSMAAVANLTDRRYQADISGVNAAGLYQVALSPSQLATLLQAETGAISVQDAQQNQMPFRLESVMQPAKEQRLRMSAYRWPNQVSLNEQDASRLQLQLAEGALNATLTFPRVQSSASLNNRLWLLVTPTTQRSDNRQISSQVSFEFDWPRSQALALDVTIEGSDDLRNWQSAGSGALLQSNSSDGQAPLRQNQIHPLGQYRYWRIGLSAPFVFDQIHFIQRDPPTVASQWHAVPFKATAVTGQWQADLGAAWPVLGWKFQLPPNQVWNIDIQAQQPQPLGQAELWQSQAQVQLQRWGAEHAAAINNSETATSGTIDSVEQVLWPQAVLAQHWRMMGQGPQANFSAWANVPRQHLLFLAQGQPPYTLQINPAQMTAPHALPNNLPAAQTAQLGAWQTVAAPLPWRTYALWAALVLVVLLLGFAAMRLNKDMAAP